MSLTPDNYFGHAIAETWGPALTSTFLAAVIYGITILQTFYYYNHYGRSDRVIWLTLVAVIFVLDTAAMALFMYCMYYYSELAWGITEMLAPDVKEFPIEYVLTSILVFIVQLFYINTIRALNAPLMIVFVLLALSLTSLATGLVLPAVQLRLHNIVAIVVAPLNHLAFNLARGTALACDLGIVIVLCWQLGSRKANTNQAKNMINALILFSVQRGVLQAVVQLGEVISYAVKPSGIYFLPFHVIVSRIYCASLLATLNTREYVARKGNVELETVQRRERDLPVVNAETGKRSELRFANVVHSTSGVSIGPDSPAILADGRRVEQAQTSSSSGSRPTSSNFLDPPFLSMVEERSTARLDMVGEDLSRLAGSHQQEIGRKDDNVAFPPGLNQAEKMA